MLPKKNFKKLSKKRRIFESDVVYKNS